MNFYLLLLATILGCIVSVQAAVIDSNSHQLVNGEGSLELRRYRERSKIMHDKVMSECPHAIRVKRELLFADAAFDDLQIEAEKELYQRLSQILIECRRSNLLQSTKTEKHTTTGIKTSQSTISPTTEQTTKPGKPLRNLARGKPVTGSPHYSNYVISHVVDGNGVNATIYQSYCSQQDIKDPFVIIDLGDIYTIERIVLWAKPPITSLPYQQQVQNMRFSVSVTKDLLDEDESLCFYRPGLPTVRPENFTCSTPKTGRYVKAGIVQVPPPQYMCFNEIEVYGR